MGMADNPKLGLTSCNCEVGGGGGGLDENLKNQKISFLERINGFQYTTEKSDSFVIDMESFSNGGNTKDINPNSRITLQRSLSRKGSLRNGGSGGGAGGERKVNSNSSPNDRDNNTVLATSSPKKGSNVGEKALLVANGTSDHSSNPPQVHHQITINTTSNMNASTESRSTIRRNSFKRPSSSSWGIDPKRVLLFFATLSSMGTILLIYFTLSIPKLSADDNPLD